MFVLDQKKPIQHGEIKGVYPSSCPSRSVERVPMGRTDIAAEHGLAVQVHDADT